MSQGDDVLETIRALVRRDKRYPVEAYVFVFEALRHTFQALGRRQGDSEESRHVTGQQLCHGIRERAIECFGPLARCVFRQWGINRTADFGDLVYNLIEVELMGRASSDDKDDFSDVFDLDEAFGDVELHVTMR